MGWRHLSQKEWTFLLFGNWLTFNYDLLASYLICFDRENWETFQCVKISEIYYQSTLCLFVDRALTPYKLKLDILLRLFEKGELLSPFFYKADGTEKSHHMATKDYNTNTMRDGGNDACNMSSSYLDVQFSFYRAMIYVHRSRRHLNLIGSCMAKQRRILKFAVNPIQNPNLTILELKTCLEVCTLLFLKHMVTWKKLKRVLKRRSLKMEKMLFPK